ncbi:MAG: hypothetical protein PHT76_11310 [Anaerostipes sp.]|nr:hypothetical protein [Anaerostipes sp.]
MRKFRLRGNVIIALIGILLFGSMCIKKDVRAEEKNIEFDKQYEGITENDSVCFHLKRSSMVTLKIKHKNMVGGTVRISSEKNGNTRFTGIKLNQNSTVAQKEQSIVFYLGGGTYNLTATDYLKNGTYSLSLHSSDFETTYVGNNTDFLTANSIMSSHKISGGSFYGKTNVTRYYKVNISNTSFVQESFKQNGTGSIHVDIYDDNINCLSEIEFSKNNTRKVILREGTYYIAVTENPSKSFLSGGPYELSIDISKVGVTTENKNYTKSQAEEIKLNQLVTGVFSLSTETKNFYKINLSKDFRYEVSGIKDGSLYGVNIYNSKGTKVWSNCSQVKSNYDKYTKGIYYIEVIDTLGHEWGSSGCYRFKVQPLSPEIEIGFIYSVKNVKSRKAKIIYDYEKVSEGYQIQYCKSKSFKRGVITKTTKKKIKKNYEKSSYTLSKLKKKQTYYVRIRGYAKNYYGNRVYGKWSAKIKVKMKK